MTGLDYDGRTEYVRPHGAPKPPDDIWAELEAAGREGGPCFEKTPRYLIAHARYTAFLRDHGYDEGIHGSEAPANAYDEEADQ